MTQTKKQVLIIGAGPAGLTAAYEILKAGEFTPVIIEASDAIGGISRTVVHNGNRMDIGGHRFFSRSKTVMEWWTNICPFQGAPSRDDQVLQRDIELAETCQQTALDGTVTRRPAPDPEEEDAVFLRRNRVSRILYLRKFFPYPIALSLTTIRNLGFWRLLKIGFSYTFAVLFKRPEKSLEDFLINRFGRELYATFFRDYTEKVWGVPCQQIPAAWGAQRIKGLSILEAVKHAARKLVSKTADAEHTTLIDQFFYPKLGPGQLWESVAADIQQFGGQLCLQQTVTSLQLQDGRVRVVTVTDTKSGVTADYFPEAVISSMPIRDLVAALPAAPDVIKSLATKLQYRDFIAVGMLLPRLSIQNDGGIPTVNNSIPDNWIYVQEPDVTLGRIQVFNNWSPYLVEDPTKVWLGLEYFCSDAEAFWQSADAEIIAHAAQELQKLGISESLVFDDAVVVRVPKAYPSYFGEAFHRFDEIRAFIDTIPNLYLVGRNGMHRYNNMDHSMLSAMKAVELLHHGKSEKDEIWKTNAEEAYHEEKIVK